MRTIKFRGKDRKWFYGSHVQLRDEHFIVRNEPSIGKMFCSNLVEPDTVGQFTGLKDKNGVEVYEGDIVRYRPNNKTYQVVFKDGIFWGEDNNGCGCAAHFFPACEIIGNVFDNSELIEKGGKHE